MQRLEEKLETIAKELNGKRVEVIFENYIIGKIVFENLDIKYNRKLGYLELIDKDNKLELNVADINCLNKEKEIEIDFDNSQRIRLLKK